jgi:hypothetical protein
MRQRVPQDGVKLWHDSQLCRECEKHDYGRRQATRRTYCGARDEETMSRSIRRRKNYIRRKEGHDGISIKNKVE